MNKLSKRMLKIASIVDKKIIADVGCDHGKLSHFLLMHNMVDFAVVSDISKPSLEKAIKLLDGDGCNYEAICCNGLGGYLGKNIEQCIISGMGGDEIIKIISNSPIEIKSYILSPQHNNISVKKFMLSIGYDITYDVIIKDKNKFYNILKCDKSDNVVNLSQIDLYFGSDNYINNPDFWEYLENEKKKIKPLLCKVDNDKFNELNTYLNLINQALKRKENNE